MLRRQLSRFDQGLAIPMACGSLEEDVWSLPICFEAAHLRALLSVLASGNGRCRESSWPGRTPHKILHPTAVFSRDSRITGLRPRARTAMPPPPHPLPPTPPPNVDLCSQRLEFVKQQVAAVNLQRAKQQLTEVCCRCTAAPATEQVIISGQPGGNRQQPSRPPCSTAGPAAAQRILVGGRSSSVQRQDGGSPVTGASAAAAAAVTSEQHRRQHPTPPDPGIPPAAGATPPATFDTADWELFELLQQAAVASLGGSGEPRRCHPQQHRRMVRSPPAPGAHCRPRQAPATSRQQQKPASPLAQHLAALRRGSSPALGMEDQQQCDTVSSTMQALQADSTVLQVDSMRSSSCSSSMGEGISSLQQQEWCNPSREACSSTAMQHSQCSDRAADTAGGAAAPAAPACTAEQEEAGAAAAAAAAVAAVAVRTLDAELREQCQHGRYEEARQALQAADLLAALEAADAMGRTALMLACAGGHGRVVKLLLRKGASLDAQDSQGCTPLHLAALHGHKGVAKHLLEAGANASLRNRAGLSGADMLAIWAAQGDAAGTAPGQEE